jgi:glycosyltransferase involved in cell wall biosynthesis
MTERVAVCIPSIPVRPNELARALASVAAQTYPVYEINVASDHDHEGAAATRNRAWRATSAPWLILLDDDDELYPFHIEALLAEAETSGASLIYPWFDVGNGWDPLAINGKPAEGHPFDDEAREHLLTVANHIPVTVLVRREALEAADGFPLPMSERWPHAQNEDWGAWVSMLNAGFTFHHLNRRTWKWWWGGIGGPGNTSGLPQRVRDFEAHQALQR